MWSLANDVLCGRNTLNISLSTNVRRIKREKFYWDCYHTTFHSHPIQLKQKRLDLLLMLLRGWILLKRNILLLIVVNLIIPRPHGLFSSEMSSKAKSLRYPSPLTPWNTICNNEMMGKMMRLDELENLSSSCLTSNFRVCAAILFSGKEGVGCDEAEHVCRAVRKRLCTNQERE